jgi:hypothetical protein
MKCKTDNCDGVIFCKQLCKNCYNKQYYLDNKGAILANNKDYYLNNKESIAETNGQYYLNNKNIYDQYHKDYRLENKEKIKKSKKDFYLINKKKIIRSSIKYSTFKLKNDPAFKLRSVISASIRSALKRLKVSKNGKSFTKYITYSVDELKAYLEQQFESWMTWNNYGMYNVKTWDDNDQSTWTWNIDHIIPQSKLLYTSMADDNFKKCWALENLRPLSAKQNLLKSNSVIEADNE